MTRCNARTLVLTLWCGGIAVAHAQSPDGLFEAPETPLVRTKCTLCHEASHITRQRLGPAEWQDVVKLMVTRGAPISPAEQATILGYLTRHYGR